MVAILSDARRILVSPTRAPLPYGLLSVAQSISDSDPHWRLGGRFEPGTCVAANITTESCAATGGTQKANTPGEGLRGAQPFTVYTFPECAPVGHADEASARASAALTNGEARAVEREFWTGTFGTTPHLAANVAVTGSDGTIEQTAATVIVSGGVDVVEGIALLEEALGDCYGNEGVIHVPAAVLTNMAAWRLFVKDGPRLRSPNGHLIAAGAGYPGTSPAGAAPATGTRWVYATGAVSVQRSEIFLVDAPADTVNRAKNDQAILAERTYLLNWDCCHFALPINIGGIVAGTFGS